MAAWKKKRKIMGRYDVTAESYDEQYADEQRRKYRAALGSVDVDEKNLLDVGCGSGLFFLEVAEKAGIVVGVDVSRKLLKKANRHTKEYPNFFVLQADADHLPFADEFFGSVFTFTVLQNMPKPDKTLAELKRVATAGGRIVVTGLKKAFTISEFMDVLEGSSLQVETFKDDEAINCYIAVLTA